MSAFTPGPWQAAVEMDGRHHKVSIMSENPAFKTEEWPYHPLIAGAYHGRGQAPRDVCNANARLIAAAPEMYAMLHEAGIKLEGFASSGDKLDDEQRSALFTAKAIRALLTQIDGE
jgi:hypothetical protein